MHSNFLVPVTKMTPIYSLLSLIFVPAAGSISTSNSSSTNFCGPVEVPVYASVGLRYATRVRDKRLGIGICPGGTCLKRQMMRAYILTNDGSPR